MILLIGACKQKKKIIGTMIKEVVSGTECHELLREND